MTWRQPKLEITFEHSLLPGHHRLRYLLRCAIILTVLGEVICLVRFGFVARDWAAAYAIAATWIKDTVRRAFLE
jgi:hypothetical protein